MTSLLPRTLVRAAVATLVLFALATPAWSQVPQAGVVKEGGYIGLTFVPQFTFDGITFDGETYYQYENGEEVMLLPRVDTRKMVRGILGFRKAQGALEVSYERTNHFGSFVGIPLKATFQAINVDGRYFFATRSRVQPHLLFGGTYPMLNIKEGSILREAFGDARFNGYGYNAEAGVTVYPLRQVGISVGYSYRALWFDRARGVTNTFGVLRPRFKETSGSVVMTANFVL